MARYNKYGAVVKKKYAKMKRRIAKAQSRAKFVGFLYLLATLALTALACLPLLTFSDAAVSTELGVMNFWKVFKNLGGGLAGKELTLAVTVLYGLMVLILAINVLKSLSKLKWLFKKKASRLYGFNRNVYAMDDMGKIFSCSFATIIVAHFLIALIVANVKVETFAYLALAAGFAIHFFCGFLGGKASLFDSDNGLEEQKREVGRISVIVRNVLQIAATAGFVYLLLQCSVVRATLDEGLTNGWGSLLGNVKDLIFPAAQLAIAVWAILMAVYATGTTEFDMEGAETAGRKNYLLLSVLMLLTAGGAFAYFKFVEKVAVVNEVLYIAIVAFVMVVLEICLIKFPKEKNSRKKKLSDEVDANTYFDSNYHGHYNEMPYGMVNTQRTNAQRRPTETLYGIELEMDGVYRVRR